MDLRGRPYPLRSPNAAAVPPSTVQPQPQNSRNGGTPVPTNRRAWNDGVSRQTVPQELVSDRFRDSWDVNRSVRDRRPMYVVPHEDDTDPMQDGWGGEAA